MKITKTDVFAVLLLIPIICLLVFFTANPEIHTYQTSSNLHLSTFNESLPTSKYDTPLYQEYPFIALLIQYQPYIFLGLLIWSVINVVRGYKKKGKFYRFIQKVYKDLNK